MGNAKTILLIEDDTFLSSLLKARLEKEGFAVIQAFDGEEGIELLKKEKPDLIILDIIMPGMDGLELLETIRKEKLTPDSIVVMLTNESGHDKIEKAKTLGIKGYVVKATSVPSEVVEEVLKIADIKFDKRDEV